MPQTPWNQKVFRDRHGRGPRTPMFGTRLPRYRTKNGLFDDIIASQVRQLSHRFPKYVTNIQFAVEDVPPSSPMPWESNTITFSQSFNKSHGIPARIVLYRLPIQNHSETRIELQYLIHNEIILQLAKLYDTDPSFFE
ncbi:MAG: metallopeptidase family protein [Bifidobacteriaceae bacterium]|nr:metallopeptidase family protein [Bifidobacteriaceae bacterium]